MNITQEIKKVFSKTSVLFTAAALVFGGTLVAAPAANANITWFSASTSSGAVGVPVVFTAFSNSPALGAAVTFSANGTVLGNVPLNNGQAQISWAPTFAGTYTVTATDGMSSSSLAFAVAPITTFTSISAPNTVAVNTPFTATVRVTSASPSTYKPQGTITIFTSTGVNVLTAPLTPTNVQAQSAATVTYSANTLGNIQYYAVYNPTPGMTTAATSTSPMDAINVTQSGSLINLKMPSEFHQNAPATLIANIAPGVSGSVSFLVNGQPLTGGLPIVNSTVTTTWTPSTTGVQTIQAVLEGNAPNQVVTVTDQVNVLPPLQNDSITLTPAGDTTWAVGSAHILLNGQQLPISLTTLSGAQASLTVSGPPCVLSGNTLIGQSGSGSCTLTATSAGGNSYSATTQQYIINMRPGIQTARISAPKSGRINKGRTVTLEKPNTQTNTGQEIVWKVTKGAANCKISYPNNGSVRMKAVKSGKCTVRGTAKSVPGQWQQYKVTRNYTIK
jgi:energy-converting hydrogenase Eha subunit E